MEPLGLGGSEDQELKSEEADRCGVDRADDKMASEYNLEGGATLHLVLALRGGH